MKINRDGKPFHPRRSTAAEDHKRSFLNPSVSLSRTLVRPTQQGLKEKVEPLSRSRMEQSSFAIEKNQDYLVQKLLEVKKIRDREEMDERFDQNLKDRLKIQTFKSTQKMFPDAMMKPNIEDDDESILDLHVSRVFSPPRESTSPHYHKPQHHRGEIGSSMPDFSEFSKRNPFPFYKWIINNNCFNGFIRFVVVKGMPTSRSIPDHASELAGSSWSGKLPHGHSYNAIDSGISLYSSDYMGPYRPKM